MKYKPQVQIPEQVLVVKVALEANRWYHVVYTCGAQGIKLGLEGQLQQENSNTTCYDDIAASTWNRIGYSTRGQMDKIKIYDYQKTPAQIAYDYNRGKPSRTLETRRVSMRHYI